jgi:hypothetical protein
MDEAPVAPDDLCVICARWPAALREAMRFAILELPMDDPVCDLCLEALAENCGWFREPEAPRH